MKPEEAASLKRLQARMNAIPKKVRAAVKPAIEKSAQEIVSKAKALAPVDSGALRNSIGYALGDGPATRATGAFRISTKAADPDLRAVVFAGNDDAYYARWIEFGTAGGVAGQRVGVRASDVRQNKSAGRKARRTHPGTPAQPFFFPAWRLGSKRATARIRRAISKAVREGWK